MIETSDGLPFIGETAEGQFVATGYSGNGMTLGTLGAMMACDRVMGSINPWRDLFSPDRQVPAHDLWNYLVENKDYPYYRIRDRFAGAAGKSLRSIRRGHGAIVDLNGEKVAAFRDEAGATTLRSPECTHMGCVVGWNDAERTWDCPCHGSRFKPNGDVLSGPAQTPLRMPGRREGVGKTRAATRASPAAPDPVALRWLVVGMGISAMMLVPALAVLITVGGMASGGRDPQSGRP